MRSDLSAHFKTSAGKLTKKTTSPSRITLRLTESELSMLRVQAGDMSMSAYVRDCVFKDNVCKRKRRSYRPVADQKALGRALYMLGASKVSNNLNQLAHHANCGSLPCDQETLTKINEAYEHVQSMRSMLIQALGLRENP